MSGDLWPWLALVLLGAYHGANPAMGWLFAVARGLQERRRSAVWEALAPIALGHEASVLLAVVLAGGAGLVASPDRVRAAGAAALVAFGLFKLLRPRFHPGRGGMRLGLREMALWSFLTSTAHGAGLMLFPVLLALPATGAGPDHLGHPAVAAGLGPTLLAEGAAAAAVHAAAMLVVMAALAFLVYEKLGVAVLRRAWVNLDPLWSLALVAAGVLTLFTA